MHPRELKQILQAGINTLDIEVNGEGNMFDVIVVSNDFEGKTPVKRQQMVYALVNEQISTGEIHAITIKTYTEDQWRTASKLKVS